MKKISLAIISMGLVLFVFNSSAAVNTRGNRSAKNGSKSIKSRPVYKKTGLSSKASLIALTKNIEYAFAKTDVRKIYYTKLDQLAAVSIENKYALSLRGYADSIGTYKGNWVISDKRANAVKEYLVNKGVDANKIITTPFGSTKPIASNKTKQGRQKNRRVEIKVNEITDQN